MATHHFLIFLITEGLSEPQKGRKIRKKMAALRKSLETSYGVPSSSSSAR